MCKDSTGICCILTRDLRRPASNYGDISCVSKRISCVFASKKIEKLKGHYGCWLQLQQIGTMINKYCFEVLFSLTFNLRTDDHVSTDQENGGSPLLFIPWVSREGSKLCRITSLQKKGQLETSPTPAYREFVVQSAKPLC